MEDKDLLNNIQEAEMQAITKFSNIFANAKRNSEIYQLEPYTSAEKQAIIKKKRYPYHFDKISHAVNTILGMQRDARFEIYFYEREPKDAVKAELYNAVWKYFSDLYDFTHIESDVFQDGVVSHAGIFGIEMDYSKTVVGDLKVSRVPYDEVIWDCNSRQYDLSDAGWMSRMRFYRKDILEEMYPDFKEEIKNATPENTWKGYSGYLSDIYYRKNSVSIHEFYERAQKNVFLLTINDGAGIVEKIYSNEQEAKQEIEKANELFDVAQLGGQLPPNMQKPTFDINSYPVDIVLESKVLGNVVLQQPKEYKMADFPYTPYFCYYNDGSWWTILDRIKDPQKYINKMFQQIEHWIGTMAKGMIRMDGRTNPKEFKEVKDAWGGTGGAVKTKYPIEQINSRGIDPSLMAILDRAEIMLENSMGGANQLGLKQTASESGRAVLARLQQSGLDHFIPIDNMRRTKALLGRKIAWMLGNEVTQPRVLRIIGDKLAIDTLSNGNVGEFFKRDSRVPNKGYLEVNTMEENSLADVAVDIVVDEAQYNPTRNQAILNNLADLGKAGLLGSMPPPEVIIELTNLPYSLKQLWIQSEAQKQQQRVTTPVKNISVNYKDLPIDTKLGILKEMGLPSDVQTVISKELEINGNGGIKEQRNDLVLTEADRNG